MADHICHACTRVRYALFIMNHIDTRKPREGDCVEAEKWRQEKKEDFFVQCGSRDARKRKTRTDIRIDLEAPKCKYDVDEDRNTVLQDYVSQKTAPQHEMHVPMVYITMV
jgi:hypothetical protein